MMPTDVADREQYLSLALFSQNFISALIDYVDDDRRENLKSSLDEALQLLSQMKKSAAASSPSGTASFTSYEHLRTVDEVWTPKQKKEVVQMIRAILQTPDDPKMKRTANKLINLFAKLQNQALWNFEQPKPVPPKVLTRLCRMA